jgi:hypothetical protein
MIRPAFTPVPTAIDPESLAALIVTVAVVPAKAQVVAERAIDGAASIKTTISTAASAFPRAERSDAGRCSVIRRLSTRPQSTKRGIGNFAHFLEASVTSGLVR